MMRNVAIGAVLGFGLVVLLLSIFNNEAPPQAVAPVATAETGGDGGAPALVPLNVAPVIVVPTLKDPPTLVLPQQRPAANDTSRSDAVLRGAVDEFQAQTGMLDTRDGGAR